MGSLMKAIADEAREEYRQSEECKAFEARKKEINELFPQVNRLAASKLSVGDMVYVVQQEPRTANKWQSWQSAEEKFYSQERLDRLKEILLLSEI